MATPLVVTDRCVIEKVDGMTNPQRDIAVGVAFLTRFLGVIYALRRSQLVEECPGWRGTAHGVGGPCVEAFGW